MWGPSGPVAYGFRSLQNDPRADVERLEGLFEYMDLNNSGDISLDEMQWFLELQGQSIKRAEFQNIVEGLGLSGPNAPLTKDKFVEFLLMKLANDPKCCFEVRASKKVPPDQVRLSDSKILKKLLLADEEEKRIAKQKKQQSRKISNWRGGEGKSGRHKTEFITMSWEELERLRSTLPDYLCAKLVKVTNVDQEEAKGPDSSGKRKKNAKSNRPATAPAGGGMQASASASELTGGGSKIDGENPDSAFQKYYIMAPTFQPSIGDSAHIAPKPGVVFREQTEGRPSTATERQGGDWPCNFEHLSRSQWEERKKRPRLDGGDDDDPENDDEDVSEAEKESREARSHSSPTVGVVTPTGDIELLKIEAESSNLLKSLKDARRSESPKRPSPNPLNSSPVLLKKAEDEIKARLARDTHNKEQLRVIEAKESELKEINTGSTKEPKVGKLPHKNVRARREEFKKLASPFAPRNRPMSATGKVNGARSALRMQRALEFERRGILSRPSTAQGVSETRSRTTS